MQTRHIIALVGLCLGLAACSAPSDPGITTLPPSGGSGSTTTAGGASGSGTTAAGGGTTVAGTGGASTTSGGSTSAGAGGVATSGGASGAVGAGGSGTTGKMGMSMGCGKQPAANVKLGSWTNMADPTMTAGNPPPVVIDGVKRGYYILVPKNYDPTKPSRVIYEGAGCGDTNAVVNGGTDGYQYQNVDSSNATQTIQVGLEYDPDRPDHCYDDQNPMSNDFQFFPWLHNEIETNYCVNMDQQFFSGYSTGSWLANQLTCAFPDVLRGVVEATGNEPPMQPTCKSGFPVAGMFLHDTTDQYNTYSGILPACTRLLKQNGCTTTQCVPSSTTTTTPYTIPTLPNGVPQGMACVSFNGCPANAQVVFCTTTQNGGNPAHYIGEDNWVLPLFWDFISKQN
jgi:poly(3-hydroxybutyrate) depolymerase